MARLKWIVVLFLAAVTIAGCSNRRTGTPRATPPAQPAPPQAAAPTPAPPQRVDEAVPVPPTPLPEDTVVDRSIDDLNRNSPLDPVYFGLDSADLDTAARSAVTANAEILRRNPSWMITIEGHCDERGTPEYNLALGERRAAAIKTYLTSLGVAPDRIRTVSYGKEFPFDPGHTEEAWAKNRRGHFVVTSR
jgi:peptidoglycan-associated lipoprotein